MEKISKNFYKGEPITNPSDIIRLAQEKRSVYVGGICRWGVKPAAVLLCMHFSIVMILISKGHIYYTIKKKDL